MIPEYKIVFHVNDLKENICIDKNVPIKNIDDILVKAGITYKENKFGKDFSALSMSNGPGNFLITFNIDQYWSENFRRFSVAHELGHIFIPDHRKILEGGNIHHSNCEFVSEKPIEREADCFAINFLAPSTLFKNKIKTTDFNFEMINILSHEFQISQYAIALRYVDKTDKPCALILVDKDGYVKFEKRSIALKNFLKNHDLINTNKIKSTTLAFDYLKGDKSKNLINISLQDWYEDLQIDIPATESIIELKYCIKLLSLVFSQIKDLESYSPDEDY